MPDEIDLAQEINDRILGDAIAAQQRAMPRGENATHCEDCGEPIPEGRRKASPGCRRCIDCQTLHENWGAL